MTSSPFRASESTRASYTASSDTTDYHTITCTLNKTPLWRILSQEPALAASVRRLTILPIAKGICTGNIDPEVLPETFQHLVRSKERKDQDFIRDRDNLSDEEQSKILERARRSEAILIDAMRNMHNLEYFNWDAYPPLIRSETPSADDPALDDVWTVLKTTKSLRHIRAVDLTSDWYLHEWRRKASPRMITSGVWDLENLHSLNFYIFWKETDHLHLARHELAIEPDTPNSRYTLLRSQLRKIMIRNPDLQDLKVNMNHAFDGWRQIDVTSAFESVHLPRLRKLHLWGLKLAPAALSNFLTSHSELEDIFVDSAGYTDEGAYETLLAETFTLPTGALSNLKKFRGSNAIRKAIEAARCEPFYMVEETRRTPYPHWLTTRPTDGL